MLYIVKQQSHYWQPYSRAGHMTRAIARARLNARLGSKNTSQGGHQIALLKLCVGQQIARLDKI